MPRLTVRGLALGDEGVDHGAVDLVQTRVAEVLQPLVQVRAFRPDRARALDVLGLFVELSVALHVIKKTLA